MEVPHFPSRVHALVWRNWQLVSTERLASVLKTTPAKVEALAESMGLPTQGEGEAEMFEAGIYFADSA